MIMKQITKNQQQTIELGKKIASKLKSGDIVLLHGNLGAGKTTLVKGIAQELNIEEEITSPTFTLMNVYKILPVGRQVKNLIHIDTYRLENEEDLIEIGVEDYLGEPDTICIIEWPEKIKGLLKNKKTIDITIEHLSEKERVVVCNT